MSDINTELNQQFTKASQPPSRDLTLTNMSTLSTKDSKAFSRFFFFRWVSSKNTDRFPEMGIYFDKARVAKTGHFLSTTYRLMEEDTDAQMKSFCLFL